MAVDTEVARVNRLYLNLVRDSAAQDPALAVAKFGIPQSQVEALCDLRADAIDRLAAGCNRCLLALSISVSDLRSLLSVPPAVASLMAATRDAPAHFPRSRIG